MGKYDVNLIKEEIIFYIATNYPEKDIHTIKKRKFLYGNIYSSVEVLDNSNYLAAGSSYSHFLKAYGYNILKGIFPYEWFDSIDKLTCTSLPKMDDFYSTLSKSNSLKSEADYLNLKEIWSTQGMQTFKFIIII